MTRPSLKEAVAFIGVVASLAFVGMEIRQNNQLARAEAFQAVGIATAEAWVEFSQNPDHARALATRDPDAIAEWTPEDWSRRFMWWSTWLRLSETILIQVEQGVLPVDATENLGYRSFENWLGAYPGFACLWPALRRSVGPALRDRIELGTPHDVDCSQYPIPTSLSLI